MAVWDPTLAQARGLWGSLTTAQRLVLVGVTAGLLAGFVSLILWTRMPEFAVLYGRLTAEDAAQIVEGLKKQGIPYRIDDGGKTLLVPGERVYDARMSLASEGIPQGGIVGFEVFDKTSFGITDFAQKVNYARALEGELTRTIRRLEGVDGARVHLVMPQRRLFEEQSQPASASVVLQLGPGRRLGAKQIQGVVYLVASSVEGLKPDRITVVDTQGNVLYQAAGEETSLLAANQLEHKRGYEKDIEARVREMLERVIGLGAAVVQVAAQFDFDRVEETSERFDPDGVAVRSEQRSSETGVLAPSPAGVPGVTSNVGPGAPPAQGSQGGNSTREAETVNYEVSKKTTRIQRTQGVLRRLTVAVAVDGSYKDAPAGGGKEFVPRSAEELAQIKSLVEKAVGSDQARGDAVEVTSIPFRPAEGMAAAGAVAGPAAYLPFAKYAVAAFLALAFLFWGVRPLIRWLTTPSRGAEITEPVTVAEMEKRLEAEAKEEEFKLEEKVPGEAVKRETLKKRVLEMIETDPATAAQLVRTWMTEE